MAIWMEIHCDVKSDGPVDPGRLDPYCFSNNNNSPGIMASSDRKSMMDALHALERVSLKNGWLKTRTGWVCPNCVKVKRAQVYCT